MARIIGTINDDQLSAFNFNLEDNLIIGSLGNDTLIGGQGNDQLVGGSGSDIMRGALGNDRYTVDADDTPANLIETAGGGFDSVISPVSWTLSRNFERLVLIGTDPLNGTGNNLSNGIIGNVANNTLDGKEGDDFLNGLAGDDILIGGEGNDKLDGDLGNDDMRGGLGNDLYFVDSSLDQVTENLDQGNDGVVVVSAALSGYTLPVNVERLFLREGVSDGNGNDLNNYIQGNSLSNTLTGGAGNDFLNGLGGNDIMSGGLSDDRYGVNDVGDEVRENPGEGFDTVTSSISYTLPVNVEKLTLLEGFGAINGTANDEGNTLIGNDDNNILTGGAGSDSLEGNEGDDDLFGGDSTDTLKGGTGNDELTGGFGNDKLFGDDGDDLLFGDLGATAGRDNWTGGAGADTFILGVGATTFYSDGDNTTVEYALIRDFTIGEDKIQLGTGAMYDLKLNVNGSTQILVDNPAGVVEIIGIVRDVDLISSGGLASDNFIFV